MKTIRLSRGRSAAVLDTLFRGPKTAAGMEPRRYDSGKYKWTGRASDYAGREVQVADDVLAVWMERRHDADGPYAASFCFAPVDRSRDNEY